jgi:hypothetical protein
MMSEDTFDLDCAKLMKAIGDDSKIPNMFVWSLYCTLSFVKILLFISINKVICSFSKNTPN